MSRPDPIRWRLRVLRNIATSVLIRAFSNPKRASQLEPLTVAPHAQVVAFTFRSGGQATGDNSSRGCQATGDNPSRFSSVARGPMQRLPRRRFLFRPRRAHFGQDHAQIPFIDLFSPWGAISTICSRTSCCACGAMASATTEFRDLLLGFCGRGP